MTWVGSINRIVMWGGSGANFLNDIVALDPATGAWTTIDPNNYCVGNTRFEPNGSDENGLVWDPIGQRLWLYNGGSGYRCVAPQLVGRTAGAGTTSTSIVDPTLSASTNYKDWQVRVNGSRAYVTAYNATTRTLTLGTPLSVVAGGAYSLFVDYGDGTWSFNFATGTYSKLQQVHWGYAGYLPAPRKSPGFVSDGTQALLFGGLDWDNGLYRLDYATGAYTVAIPQGAASSPPARGQIQGHFVYDSIHDKFVLFGGRCFDPVRCAYGGVLDDTWVYDPNTNQWTQATPVVRPPARNQGHMYFDVSKGVVVLYGGMGSGVLNDLWTFDVATLKWTQQAMPAVNPGGVYLGQVAYATTTQCGYIVYGGSAAGATGVTWKLCLAAIGNQPPVASFTTTPSTTTVGSPVALSAAASSDPDGTITNFAWNFGDGTTGSGVSTSKSYSATGTFTIALTVTDNNGATATTTRTVVVAPANQPPVASFVATPSPTTVGTAIAFSGAASSDPDGSITSYAWNFGDGTTGSGVSVSKGYAAVGTYTVALTVTDNRGATASRTGSVTITAGGGTTIVWVEDDWPAGAVVSGTQDFTWTTANPVPYSGSRAHQSAITAGVHQHFFTGATATLSVGVGDKLFAYVYLDPANPPREVMLQFNDGTWEHRAYWGSNFIPYGSGGPSKYYVGPLPAVGQWVRLEVSAANLGLEGRTLNGMAFTLYDGRATWDRAGKTASP